MKRTLRLAARPATLLAGVGLLASNWLLPASGRAADKYDTDLERRVETLERELNIMEGDKKGKNAEEADVPTFLRASKNVKELVISGELRLRNEYSQTDSQVADKTAQADRWRFRFRLAADYKLNDNFFAGAAIQTSQAADSGNTTFTEGFDNYSVYLWRFFVGYKNDWLTVTAGKHANPFYSNTEMLIDADVSPTGVSEVIKLPLSPQFEVQLIAGQFIFYDNAENAAYNNPRTPSANFAEYGTNNKDSYLLYQQAVLTYKPSNDVSVTAAGGYLFYPGHGGTGGLTGAPTYTAGEQNAVGPAAGTIGSGLGGSLQGAANLSAANATRDLNILTGSGDVKLGFGALKVKPYVDAAYNVTGGARNNRIYGIAQDDFQDKLAFSAGVLVGSDYTIKKKGDYTFLAEYRQVGLGSLDPNLNDSDFNFSRLGFRGLKAAFSYGFQPWLIGSVTYFGSENLGRDRNLNIGVGNFNAANIFQFDLTTKF